MGAAALANGANGTNAPSIGIEVSVGSSHSSKIEVENNQVSFAPAPPLPPLPGFTGEAAKKGDGVIADPATELDASAGLHVTPDRGAQLLDPLITKIKDDLKGLVDNIITAVNGSDGDARRTNPSKADSPVWQGLRPAGNGVRTDGDRLYEWDYTHNDIEVYDRRGRHLGSADPVSGELYKPAVPGRKLNR